jgi:hypothetical protein
MIGEPVAVEIDRLSRAAHRFHRYAHHPLCERYAGEVVRIGRRTRLCRGCVYACVGGTVGGVIGYAIADPHVAIGSTIVGVIALCASLRWRLNKIITRMIPAALLALAIVAGVTSRSSVGVVAALAAVASTGGLRLLYGRRGADRSPCETCPERVLQPCSGFAAIVSRERAFQRVAGQLLTRSNAVPSRRLRPARPPAP